MTNPATLDTLLDQMHQYGEVLNGWDAVMNLLESTVNQFFQNQWTKHSGGSGKMSISCIWCDGVNPARGGGYTTTVIQLEIQLGAPLFQFAGGSDSVNVTQEILGGSLKTGSMDVPQSFKTSACGCQVDDPKVTWAAPQTIDVSSNPSLSGPVPLEMVQGVINASTRSLLLDFAKGAFQLNKVTVTGVKDQDIVDQLQGWFMNNKITYVLASVNFQDITSLPALTPTAFEVRVLSTNAGNTIVQLLITTNGSQPASGVYPLMMDEVVPTADGYTYSLMVSSEILFKEIFVPSFNLGQTALTAVATQIKNYWCAVVEVQQVSTPNIFPPDQPYQTSNGLMAVELLAAQWSFHGLSFGPSVSGIELSFSEELALPTGKITIVDGMQTYGPFQVPMDAIVSISGENSLTISGSGADQKLQISATQPTVTVGLSDKSGKLINASLHASTKATNASLESAIQAPLTASLGAVKFEPVSVFALGNIIFPDASTIQMSKAFTPGDLLIVGTMQLA